MSEIKGLDDDHTTIQHDMLSELSDQVLKTATLFNKMSDDTNCLHEILYKSITESNKANVNMKISYPFEEKQMILVLDTLRLQFISCGNMMKNIVAILDILLKWELSRETNNYNIIVQEAHNAIEIIDEISDIIIECDELPKYEIKLDKDGRLYNVFRTMYGWGNYPKTRYLYKKINVLEEWCKCKKTPSGQIFLEEYEKIRIVKRKIQTTVVELHNDLLLICHWIDAIAITQKSFLKLGKYVYDSVINA